MTTTAPLVFGFVLIFAFLILLASFRSLVVAIKAIVLNLLSVGAAYGILVATFQWGWGENLLGFESNGGITPWLPMFLFVILFGLSMDYHVFILSRVREAYDRGLSNEDAVAHGIKSSAGVVTSAAVVMVGTFSVFALLPVIDMKEMGIGLAAAVLIDATLIRAVLLPATMKLLGDRNWYLPKLARVAPPPRARAGSEGPRGPGARPGRLTNHPSRRRRCSNTQRRRRTPSSNWRPDDAGHARTPRRRSSTVSHRSTRLRATRLDLTRQSAVALGAGRTRRAPRRRRLIPSARARNLGSRPPPGRARAARCTRSRGGRRIAVAAPACRRRSRWSSASSRS